MSTPLAFNSATMGFSDEAGRIAAMSFYSYICQLYSDAALVLTHEVSALDERVDDGTTGRPSSAEDKHGFKHFVNEVDLRS